MLDCAGALGQPCQLCSSRKVGLTYALGQVWAWVWVQVLHPASGTWQVGPPLWEYKAPLPGQLQWRAGDSQALPSAFSATSVYPLLPLPAPSACWQKLAGKCLWVCPSSQIRQREHSGDAAGWGRGWYQDPGPQQLPWPDSCHLGTRGLPALGPASPPRSLARLVAEGRPARYLPGQGRSGPTRCCHDPVQTQVTHVLPSPWPLL